MLTQGDRVSRATPGPRTGTGRLKYPSALSVPWIGKQYLRTGSTGTVSVSTRSAGATWFGSPSPATTTAKSSSRELVRVSATSLPRSRGGARSTRAPSSPAPPRPATACGCRAGRKDLPGHGCEPTARTDTNVPAVQRSRLRRRLGPPPMVHAVAGVGYVPAPV
ncbi:hypothetical protein AB0K15_11215 [Amycolatopsis sp. NPDC049253]|uniref:hypothetical protein n=1 Tax=Amycolatopsis sp. NPDC049253 TaxID=3155274 RepID=UPI00342B08CF